MTKQFCKFFAATCVAVLGSSYNGQEVVRGGEENSSLQALEIPRLAESELSAYPTIDRLHDGRLICVFSTRLAGKDATLKVAATFSSDHGATWSHPKILLNTETADDYDPSVVVIGQSVIVTSTATPAGVAGITTSRIMAVRSDDNGHGWSAPWEIPDGRQYTSGKTNRGIVLRDGAALLGFTWEKNLESGRSARLDTEGEMEEVNAVLISYDQGRTWAASESVELSERRTVNSLSAINGVCEPALIECADGSILMIARTGLEKLYSARSWDGGKSWSTPEPTSLVSHNAPAALCDFAGPRPGVAVVWNNSPRNRWPLCVAASFDGGRHWSRPRVITDGDSKECSYPSCVMAADGAVVVVYQQRGDRGSEILGVKFSPSWITDSSGEPPLDRGPLDGQASASSDPLQPPRQLAHFAWMPKPVTLPDGTLAALFLEHEGPGLPATPERQTVYARYSGDHGQTWGEAEPLVELPADGGAFGYFVPLVDQQGEIHLWLLGDAQTGVNRPRPVGTPGPRVEPLSRQRLDVWHVRSQNQRTAWTKPRSIWTGRAGDLQSATQLSSGRLLLPLSYFVDRSWSNRGAGPSAFTYHGQFDTTVLYSDDNGQTWQQSASVLRLSTPSLSAYGAVEPVVLELRDGRVWMLLRTQLGRFYESFSRDQGVTWSPAEPSQIVSSDSPAALLRLGDDRIVLLWNQCQRHPYAQGSRHTLHAAISHDDGETWTGCREVMRDPFRKHPPPPTGDHGVAYPFATEAADGSVVFSLWVQTGEGRSLQAFDPEWLEATHVEDDFSDGVSNWSTFGTRGVSLAQHPDFEDRKVMKLCRSHADWPTAALWNFPKGETGNLRARVWLPEGSPGLQIELANHFSPPFDPESGIHCLFQTTLSSQADEFGLTAPAGAWADIELRWDCQTRECLALVNGQPQLKLRQQHEGPGPNYLRLSLPREAADLPCLLLEEVVVLVN